jgi:hypothetical protein
MGNARHATNDHHARGRWDHTGPQRGWWSPSVAPVPLYSGAESGMMVTAGNASHPRPSAANDEDSGFPVPTKNRGDPPESTASVRGYPTRKTPPGTLQPHTFEVDMLDNSEAWAWMQRGLVMGFAFGFLAYALLAK